jgi:hypothetical protein
MKFIKRSYLSRERFPIAFGYSRQEKFKKAKTTVPTLSENRNEKSLEGFVFATILIFTKITKA